MKILLDIGTNATETPLCLKIFILHLISEMPEYFKPFSTEWEAFCISTLVDYSADTRLFDDRFQDFFKRMTSILADWHDDHGDVMMKNVANSGRADLSMLSKLKTFFNNWIKVLAYTKGVIKSKALDHFKILFKHWFQEMNSQIPNLRQVYFAGGEPLMIKEHKMFIEEIIRQGYQDKILLRYNSNGLLVDEDLIELWSKFKKVKFCILLVLLLYK